jgi:GDP-mannose 6-dehydrogenase
LLTKVVAEGRLTAVVDAADAVAQTDLALICVGTPGNKHGQPSVDHIRDVGGQIGHALTGRKTPFTVVLRSTSLPGTTEDVLLAAIRAANPSAPVHVGMNPEFMREGVSLHDFDFPPMVIIGTEDPVVSEQIRELYAGIDAPFVSTTTRTAEIVKYACNAYHGLKVTFANEMAALCDVLGADALEVMRIFAMDKKLNISEAYLRPGFAFGGSCLPKDVRALVWAATSHHLQIPVLSAVLPSNTGLIQHAVASVLATKKKKIGIVGLAFKPNTDDLRESPVVTLVETLIGKGCQIRILDKSVSIAKLVGANKRYIEAEIPHISSLLCEDVQTLVEHAEVLVVGSPTEHAQRAMATAKKDTVVIDLTRTATRSARAAVSG